MANTQLAVESEETTAVTVFAGMEEDSNLGREQMTSADMAMPYISVLQTNSPQCSRADPLYIKGAEAGMFYNTVTQEVYGEELFIVPCSFQKVWNEWIPRSKGGGFVASYPTDEKLNICNRDEKGYDVRQDNGNQIIPTFLYFVLVSVNEQEWTPAVISLTRTQLQAGRKLNALVASLFVKGQHGQFNPPMFSQIFKVSSEGKSNAEGSWFVWKFQFSKLVDMETYERAKAIAKQVQAGEVKAAPPVNDAPAERTVEDTDAF
jgi:hypothetical protein